MAVAAAAGGPLRVFGVAAAVEALGEGDCATVMASKGSRGVEIARRAGEGIGGGDFLMDGGAASCIDGEVMRGELLAPLRHSMEAVGLSPPLSCCCCCRSGSCCLKDGDVCEVKFLGRMYLQWANTGGVGGVGGAACTCSGQNNMCGR